MKYYNFLVGLAINATKNSVYVAGFNSIIHCNLNVITGNFSQCSDMGVLGLYNISGILFSPLTNDIFTLNLRNNKVFRCKINNTGKAQT
jgi:hypothetical protein